VPDTSRSGYDGEDIYICALAGNRTPVVHPIRATLLSEVSHNCLIPYAFLINIVTAKAGNLQWFVVTARKYFVRSSFYFILFLKLRVFKHTSLSKTTSPTGPLKGGSISSDMLVDHHISTPYDSWTSPRWITIRRHFINSSYHELVSKIRRRMDTRSSVTGFTGLYSFFRKIKCFVLFSGFPPKILHVLLVSHKRVKRSTHFHHPNKITFRARIIKLFVT
jgi:hypothetical protein